MKSFTRIAAAAIAAVALSTSTAFANGHITRASFGKMPNGTPVSLYTLSNSHGMQVEITNLGGIITSIRVPDRHGKVGEIALGYDNLAGYVKNVNNPYFGAIAGRYANRIARGHFTLDGHVYTLPINNTPNSLHGGTIGFDKIVWNAAPIHAGDPRLALSLVSVDGDQGYPGALHVKVVYTLTDANELKIDYTATTDADTVVNLTSHSYFNLAGAGNGDILPTRLTIDADRFTPIDKVLIPTGIQSVTGTPFDFRKSTAIGARIGKANQQLKFGNGYDHNWILNHPAGKLGFAVRAYDPRSGRVLTMSTTEPGVQCYTGNFLDGKNIGHGGKSYKFRYGFALEAQHFPDSPNHPKFPSTELKPGQTYRQTTVYKFSTI